MPENSPMFAFGSDFRNWNIFLLPSNEYVENQINLNSNASLSYLNRALNLRRSSFSMLIVYLRNQVFSIPKRNYAQPVSEKEW